VLHAEFANCRCGDDDRETELNASVKQLISPLQKAVDGLQQEQEEQRKRQKTEAQPSQPSQLSQQSKPSQPAQPAHDIGGVQPVQLQQQHSTQLVPQLVQPPQQYSSQPGHFMMIGGGAMMPFTYPQQIVMMPPQPMPQPVPQPQMTAEDAELQRLLAQEEARQAAERVRAREAQARIAELQALAKYRHTQ
jgi:hypothetical protein